MDNDNSRNLILASILSLLVIVGWFALFPPAEKEAATNDEAAQTSDALTPAAPDETNGEAEQPLPAEDQNRFRDTARLAVDTPALKGSIALMGGRIDDLLLKNYHETIDKNSPNVRMLTPELEPFGYYAFFGWTPRDGLGQAAVPGPDTEWTTDDTILTPDHPVTLRWDNGSGLIFTRNIAVDDQFMFTVTDNVENTTGQAVRLAPFSQVRRHDVPPGAGYFILHEGAISRVDGRLNETTYSKMTKMTRVEREGNNPTEYVTAENDSWIGFTDHYWMTILIPEKQSAVTTVMKYVEAASIYLTEVRHPDLVIQPGQSAANTLRMFSGAKEWEAIRHYQNDPGFFARLGGQTVDPDREPVLGFIDSIDWGWFYFLTKPIFALLHWLHGFIGNMGLSIIALTFVLKTIVLPLAYKSYVSMARMKELQPEMEAIKERAGDDRQKMQKEIMQLYRSKKVNPASGCLPLFIQAPIFFSLYKVIFVTIELRHAPFFGWLQDLSAPDPSSIFNLFGLLPWAAPTPGTIPAMIFIGVLPLLLGITMWLQQKLNPAPTDPVQATILGWMPVVFMFMLGNFASGLVLYWITNNILTFTQQYLIMRSHGHRPDLFGNIKSGFQRKKKATEHKAPTDSKGGK